MANVIIKEEQRFQDPLSYGVLGVLLFATVFVFAQDMLLHSSPVQLPGWFYALSLLLLGAALWYFTHLRFKLSITEKGIKFRFEPFLARKRRISWDEIASYAFVETNWLAGLSGGNVNFSSLEHSYSLCGRNGLMVHTKAGETIFLGSRSLLARREEIERYMNPYLSQVK